MAKYFAYGANLNKDKFKERCPSGRFISFGILEKHELVFNKKNIRRFWQCRIRYLKDLLRTVLYPQKRHLNLPAPCFMQLFLFFLIPNLSYALSDS